MLGSLKGMATTESRMKSQFFSASSRHNSAKINEKNWFNRAQRSLNGQPTEARARSRLDLKKLGLARQLLDRQYEVWTSWTQNFEELRLKAATETFRDNLTLDIQRL